MTLRGSTAPLNASEQAQRLERGVRLAADDDVVVYRYAECLGGFDHLVGGLDILGRGGRVAARVVVHHLSDEK